MVLTIGHLSSNTRLNLVYFLPFDPPPRLSGDFAPPARFRKTVAGILPVFCLHAERGASGLRGVLHSRHKAGTAGRQRCQNHLQTVRIH